MKNGRMGFVLAGAVVAGAAYGLYASFSAAAEKVKFTLIEKDGELELREYPSLAVATSRSANDSDAFRPLFGFISRGNSTHQKIAMTTPVLIDRRSDETVMNFIMPEGMAVPAPVDPGVKVGRRAGGRIAALRFGGFGTRAGEERAIEQLRRHLAERGMTPQGEPIIAYYDSPWTPPPFRRNEVMLRLQ